MYGPKLSIQDLKFGLQYSMNVCGDSYIYYNDQIIVKSIILPDERLRNVIISVLCQSDLPCGYISTTKVDRCNRIISIYHCEVLVAKIITHKKYYKNSTGTIRIKELDNVDACYV